MDSGFVVLGAACRDGEGDDGIALPVRSYSGSAPLREQWSAAVEGAAALGERVVVLVERRVQIGAAQKEAILILFCA